MKSKEEILAEKMRLMPSSIDRYKNDNSYRVGVNECLAAMQKYADQQTSTLYTRAQLLEFGEKVRQECASKATLIYHDGFAKCDNVVTYFQSGCDNIKPNKQSIQSINIESLLK